MIEQASCCGLSMVYFYCGILEFLDKDPDSGTRVWIFIRPDLVLAAAWNIVQYIGIPITCYMHSASKRVFMSREKVF